MTPSEPSFRPLDPEMESQMRARRARTRELRERGVEDTTAGAAERAAKSIWGPYELLEELGEGAAGVVWRARRADADADGTPDELAVKLLRRAVVDREEQRGDRARVLEDLTPKLAALHHPQLVRAHECATHDGRTGLVMDFVRGVSLDALLREREQLDFPTALELVAQICDGVDALHRAGIVHRDIKPRNVMVGDDGQARLMDPSCAAPLAAGASDRALALSYSPQFMAPEILRAEAATVASDVYSLGVLLYYALSRRLPVKGPMVAHLRRAHAVGKRVSLESARPGVPHALAQLVHRCLSVDAGERPPDAVTLATEIRALRSSILQRASSPPERAGLAGWWSGLRSPLRALVIVFGLIAVFVILYLGSSGTGR